jgi:flagellar biosynthesis protein FlhB
MNDLSSAVNIFIVGVTVAVIVYFLTKYYKANLGDVTRSGFAKTESTEVTTANTRLGVWSGIKFGFGFTIGTIIAITLVTIILAVLLDITLREILLPQ